MLRLLLRSPWVKRVSRGVPVARLLLVGEVAILAQRHLSKLDRAQRRRLFTLLVRATSRGLAGGAPFGAGFVTGSGNVSVVTFTA